jgi:2-haloacid dehalogenase
VSDPEVLAFDLYGTLVDPIGISTTLTRLTNPVTALELARLWRQRQLEYSFRVTAMERYQDFRWVTARALEDALAVMAIDLDVAAQSELVAAYDHLTPFPDVEEGLTRLAAAGHRLTVLSNGSPAMIANSLTNSGLDAYIDLQISADEISAFKPAPLVYLHASTRIGRPIGEIRMVSSNPFDVIGSKSAGMRTAWVDRAGGVFDSIGQQPDLLVNGLDGLCRALDIPT